MTAAIFRKSIFISLIAHGTFFCLFSFSFGNKIIKPGYAPVCFWGNFLLNSQVIRPAQLVSGSMGRFRQDFMKARKESVTGKPDALILKKAAVTVPLLPEYYLKPPITSLLNAEKIGIIDKPFPALSFPKKKESVVVFHPLLPNSFTLYFKDRQIVHVELAFDIVSTGERSFLVIKRKISSGNLEVDLLCKRYIGNYLFIQKARFVPNKWQNVKIDFSARDD